MIATSLNSTKQNMQALFQQTNTTFFLILYQAIQGLHWE